MANIPQRQIRYNGLDDTYTFPQTAQNLIPYPYAGAAGTSNGITRTINADGSVTVDGTATAASYYYTTNASSLVKLQAGTYRLDGCPSGGGSGTYRLQIGHYASGTFTSYGFDSGEGLDFTVTDSTEDDYIGIRIAISSGATVSNLTFYPQLTLTAPYDWQSPVESLVSRAHNALTEAPVQSVNGQTGAVVLSIPSSASDVGAIAAPSSPASGAFLVWNGTAWVAQTLSTWQGGSY